MGLLGRIFFGLLGIALGSIISIKNDWFTHTFGRLNSVEKVFGPFGGSRIFYILLGILIAIMSVLYIFGVFPGIITSIIASIFGRSVPAQ